MSERRVLTQWEGHKYLVLPFDLLFAPAVFQEFINYIFHEFLGWFILVYLDDILSYSSFSDEHRCHVRGTPTKLCEHSFYAKLSKHTFHVSNMLFLGYIISNSSFAIDFAKVQT